mgnify:CR=1 FL=1
MKELLQRLAEFRLGTYVIFLGLTGYFAATQPGFLDSANLLSLARQYSELGIVAVGMTLVIATGGIDISVGGIVGLTAMLVGVLGVTLGWNIWAAAGVGLCAAAAVGAVNGFAIAYMGVQPVLVTLATMSLTRGIAYILTSGTSLSINQPGFQANGTHRPLAQAGLLSQLGVAEHLPGGNGTFPTSADNLALLGRRPQRRTARLTFRFDKGAALVYSHRWTLSGSGVFLWRENYTTRTERSPLLSPLFLPISYPAGKSV